MTNETKRIYTDFLSAVDWQQQSILCNNILEIEPDLLFTDDRFIDEPMSEDEFLADKNEAEYYDNDYDMYLDSFEQQRFEAYQWFITDLTDRQAEFKHKTFGLEYYYSEKLECYIMPVYHLGTSWRLLPCEIKDAEFAQYNQDMIKELDRGYIKQ